MEVHIVRTHVRAAQQFWLRYRIFARYKREVLVYFVASILSGGNVPAYFTTTSTFMAIKLLYEPLLLRLANDVETNPVDRRSGPRPLPVFTLRARTCKTSH